LGNLKKNAFFVTNYHIKRKKTKFIAVFAHNVVTAIVKQNDIFTEIIFCTPETPPPPPPPPPTRPRKQTTVARLLTNKDIYLSRGILGNTKESIVQIPSSKIVGSTNVKSKVYWAAICPLFKAKR
jgi:hypothetical protein